MFTELREAEYSEQSHIGKRWLAIAIATVASIGTSVSFLPTSVAFVLLTHTRHTDKTLTLEDYSR